MTMVGRFGWKIIGWDVAEDKSTERLQELVDTSPKAETYHSDGYVSYREIVYEGKHFAHYGWDKSETYTVEGVNSDLRKYIPFLQRKSKCFLRSIETAKMVLRIFVYAYNRFCEAKIEYPRLKSALYLTQFVWFYTKRALLNSKNNRPPLQVMRLLSFSLTAF